MTCMSAIAHSEQVRQAKEHLDKGGVMIVFDLETTGLAKNSDRVLSYSALQLIKSGGLLTEIDRLNLFINPGFHIPAAITKINHISDETVKDCGTEFEAAPVIREFMGDNPFLAGYNSISFDEPFLHAMFQRVFGEDFTPVCHLDVLKMAKEKLPELKSHTLSSVADKLGTDIGLEFHNSMDDVIATARSMKMLLDMYDDVTKSGGGSRVYVSGAKYWAGPSSQLQRVYITTKPYTKTYYDVYKSRWMSEADIDLDKVREDVLRKYRVSNEKELVKALPK